MASNTYTLSVSEDTEATLTVSDDTDTSYEVSETFITAISPTATVESTDDGALITITDKNGTTTATITNGTDGTDGVDGTDGTDGTDGVGISSVTQTTTSTSDGGTNVITVTLTNGNTFTFNVLNGSKGSTGATGATGATGQDGSDGADGEDGNGISSIAKTSTSGLVDTYTITFTDGTTTTFTVTNGQDGSDGADGSDATVTSTNIINALGYTPADEEDIPVVPTVVSAFTNDSGYLTEHQDISGKSDVGHTHTRAECNDAIASKTYTGILRTNATYTSPYTPSYFYFGQAIPTDLDLPSHFTYHIVAYATSNSNYLLDAVVRWDLSTDGIYKAYWIWNNNNSTSYYPFGYHSLYRSNNATISASDGCYFGGYYGTSKSYGQNPNTLERTFEVELLEVENCTVTLTDDVIFFDDTDNMPTNLVQTSTSYAYNTTNFTVVNITTSTGLQETGDGNTNYYDRMVWGYAVLDTSVASGRYSLGFVDADGCFCGIAQTSSTGTSKTLNTSVEIDPNLMFYQLTTTYAASKTIGASALYSRYNLVDIRYSCNQGSWMTARQPIYIMLNPCDDGYFTINSTVFTHTLPTTNDGIYYKFVGLAYNTYQFVFEPRETLYYHDGTKLCRY